MTSPAAGWPGRSRQDPVRAGLLGWVAAEDDKFRGTWPTPAGDETELFKTKAQAVKAVSRHAEGGLRFHDLRHSYASWLITSGVPVPDVQRVMGHERSAWRSTPTSRGGCQERVLGALAAFSLPCEG
ncbi:tyrosine-type recombinase/integrase [Kribbella sp. NPDC023972]|uniref:tyrosine-type recombinase/integrase n=1 Tax=Kribbella sp. NPDC023972 TaxID=3154795 RepID=UPI0033D25E17